MTPIEMVRREMTKKHISQADLARKLNMNPTSVLGMLKRSSIHTHKLIKLCEIFDYNFFREIAASMTHTEPNYDHPVNEQEIKAPLLERIKELEIEVNILKQTLKDLVTR